MAERIVVLGLMGRFSMAGVAWQALQYVIGLERLGFEVFYVEDSGAPPYDPRSAGLGTTAQVNVEFVRSAMRRAARPEHWAYWDVLEDRHHGLTRGELDEVLGGADQIWNLCGATRLRREHGRGAVRVYVQTDPGFEQIAAAGGNARERAVLDSHDVLFTYGENLVGADRPVPRVGRRWHPTRPPVLLDQWETTAPDDAAPFTTVGSWSNRGKDVSWAGVDYRWSKDTAFASVAAVPATAGVRVLAAVSPPEEIRGAMEQGGWSFADPRAISRDLDDYRRFIQASCGEFTVAKDLYVRSRSGWFSDRSACYLASGRPVVTQDTGFGGHVPPGRGLLAYRTPEQAAAALRNVRDDLPGHADAARSLARGYFDARIVLGAMLEAIDADRGSVNRP